MAVSRTIKAFEIPAVKDETLPRVIPNSPLSRRALHDTLTNPPIMITPPENAQDSLPFNDANHQIGNIKDILKQPGPTHNRSFMLTNETFRTNWQDEFGNTYSAVTLKGNNFSSPAIMEHPTASMGYIAYGLQESAIIERVIKASRILREKNISTEYILGLSEPRHDQYLWPTMGNEADASEIISLDEYKQRIIKKYIEELPKDRQTPEELAKMTGLFENVTFYISLRATDIAYRLHDLSRDEARTETFDYINAHLLEPNEKPLDYSNIEDHYRYINQYMVPRLAANLARLHAARLAHGFIHRGNVTALGGIVDLDSVHGTPLDIDDQPVTDEDYEKDLRDAINMLLSIANTRQTEEIAHDEISAAINEFTTTYIDEFFNLFTDKNEAISHLRPILAKINSHWYIFQNNYEAHSLWLQGLNHMHDYFYEVITSDLEEGESESDEEYYVDIFEINPKIYDCAKNLIVASINQYTPHIISAFREQISEAFCDGEDFDVVTALLNDTSSAEFARSLMCEEAVRPVMNMVLDGFSTEHHVKLFEYARAINQTFIAPGSKTRQIILDGINQKLLPEIESELRNALVLNIPETILPSRETTRISIAESQDSSVCLISEHIPLEQLIQSAKNGIDQITSNKFAEGATERLFLHIPQAGHHVSQVISDSTFESVTVSDLDSSSTMTQIDVGSSTSYVCVVEEDETGQQKLCLYYDQSVAHTLVGITGIRKDTDDLTLF